MKNESFDENRILEFQHSLGSRKNTYKDKTHRYKLVYKRKIRVDGKIETYVARLQLKVIVILF